MLFNLPRNPIICSEPPIPGLTQRRSGYDGTAFKRYTADSGGEGSRARAEDRHAASRHIEKLRQFVHAWSMLDRADACGSPVAPTGLAVCAKGRMLDIHRSELQDPKEPVIATDAQSPEEAWSLAVALILSTIEDPISDAQIRFASEMGRGVTKSMSKDAIGRAFMSAG